MSLTQRGLDNIKMSNLPLFNNPIHTIKLHVAEMVWDHYYKKVLRKIGESKLTEGQKHSYRTALKKYYEGERKPEAILRMIPGLKTILISVLPIDDTIKFFEGSLEDIDEEAKATSRRMMKDFEELYKIQKNQKRALV